MSIIHFLAHEKVCQQQHFLCLLCGKFQTKTAIRNLTIVHCVCLHQQTFADELAQHDRSKLKIYYQSKSGASAQALGESPQIRGQSRYNCAPRLTNVWSNIHTATTCLWPGLSTPKRRQHKNWMHRILLWSQAQSQTNARLVQCTNTALNYQMPITRQYPTQSLHPCG